MEIFKTKEEFVKAITKESDIDIKENGLNFNIDLCYNLSIEIIKIISYNNPLVIKEEKEILVDIGKFTNLFKDKEIYQFSNGKNIFDYSYLVLKDEILNSAFDKKTTYKDRIIDIIAIIKGKIIL